ncbi:hypothetical protein F5Y17DRAFT_424098 [Xylariaceae sp. FL0594]|nr:hypothetical protein F5Y17DRAFT_424098 [Xylariaceae sp. FL0594]
MRSSTLAWASTSLGLAILSSAQPTSGTSSVDQFISKLNVSPSVASAVKSAISPCFPNGNASSTTCSGPQLSALACNVNSIVFGSGNEYLNSSSPAYVSVIEHNWSEACWLDARCVVQPASTQDVSRALLITSYMGTTFSVRSGGHNPNPGFASNVGGTLIDLVNLNQIGLSKDGSYALVGPGNRFGAVLKELDAKYQKSIVGGRIEDVGVGGYYLGGGMAFFSSRFGLAANTIRNYEVVLPDGSIVNANAKKNADLFWALKGGGPNFGIVTRYDINTVPAEKVWFEAFVYDPSQNEALLAAVVEYAKLAEADEAAGLVFNLTPQGGLVGFIYGNATVRPPVYAPFYNITPSATYAPSTVGSWVDLADAFAGATDETPSNWMIVSIAHKWSLDALNESYAEWTKLAAQVASSFNATLAFGVQPFTSTAVKNSNAAGGSPLGLEAVSQNWFTSTIQWQGDGHDAEALAAIQSLGQTVADSSAKYGAALPFRFMNDANHAQDVFKSYGDSNLARLRQIAAKYDPNGVMQKLQNDGWLLSKA